MRRFVRCMLGIAATCAWLGVAGPVRSASATVYSVSVTADDANLGPNGNCTLREAILAANTNAAVDACPAGSPGLDTIQLAAGTYTLTIGGAGEDAGATGDLDVREDLKIVGAGSATTIISAAGLGDRVLQVAAGVSLSISDVTLSGGRVIGGTGVSAVAGGIWNDGNLTLLRTVVTDNQAVGGAGSSATNAGSGTAGAILNSSTGTLTLDGTELSQNVAVGGNGSFGCCSLSCSCMFGTAGGAGRAGAVENQGTLSIRGSTIQDNSVSAGRDGSVGVGSPNANGGGVVSDGGTATILDTLFARNHATGGSGANGGAGLGGALFVGGGSVSVEQSLLSENTAAGNASVVFGVGGPGGGAGAFVASGATLSLKNSTLAKNAASGGPGGVISTAGGPASGGAVDSDGTVTIASSTFADNSVTSGAGTGGAAAGGVFGGAINSDGSTTVVNSVVASSSAVVPGGATTGEACDGAAAPVSSGGNIESPIDTCTFHASGDFASVAASSLALQPLANNGGATWTQALGTGSLAINTGVSASCPQFDQRHYARTGICDRGAFEVGATPCTDADHDGYSVEGGACGPVDCLDTNPNVHPGATEIPGNGLDDDCNPATPGACQPQLAEAASGSGGGQGGSGLGEWLAASLVMWGGLRSMRRGRRQSSRASCVSVG